MCQILGKGFWQRVGPLLILFGFDSEVLHYVPWKVGNEEEQASPGLLSQPDSFLTKLLVEGFVEMEYLCLYFSMTSTLAIYGPRQEPPKA